MTQLKSNTDHNFFCVQCGSNNTSIIREGDDPRLKCNECNFMFGASQSKAAEEAGAIPDGPPKLADEIPTTNPRQEKAGEAKTERSVTGQDRVIKAIPRSPAYVFISKQRDQVEFCTNKDLKRTVLKWQYGYVSHDIYQLTPKVIKAKIEIDD